MAKNKKIKEKTMRVAKELNDNNPLKKLVDGVEQSVYGTSTLPTDELDAEAKQFNALIADVLKTTDDEFNGDLMGTIRDYVKSSNGGSDDYDFKQIKDLLETDEGMSSGLLTYAFSSYDSKTRYYQDLKLVSSLIPQLSDAIDVMADAILSSDDFTNTISLQMPGSEQDEYEKLDEKYELYAVIRTAVVEYLTFGIHRIATIPYDMAFFDIKNRFAKQHGVDLKNLNSDKVKTMEIKALKEDITSNMDFKTLSESFSGPKLTAKKAEEGLLEGMDYYIEEFVNNIEICEGVSSLLDISEFTKEEFESYQEAYFHKTDGDILSEANRKSKLDGFIEENTPKSDANDKSFKSKLFANNDIDEINGCIVKHLDVEKIIPVKVDDTVLGFYYLESNGAIDIIKETMTDPLKMLNKNLLQNSTLDSLGSNNNDVIFTKLSDFMVKLLCKDKAFLKNNAQFKEEIYAILKYGDMANKKIKVTFLPANQVEEFGAKNGASMLRKPLFYAKIYLAMLLTNLNLRISRGYDKRIYKVKQGASKDVGSQVTAAIRDIKKDQRSVLMMGSVNSILNTAGATSDLFIPVDRDGNQPIEYDIMSAQDIVMKDDIMEFIEERMVNGTGVPLPLLQASTDVDFAKSLQMLNSKFLRKALTEQRILNPSVNRMYNKIRAYERGVNVTDENYEPVKVGFLPPSALGVASMLEQINNSKDLVDTLVRTYMGDSSGNEDVYEEFTRQLMKKFCTVVPWSDFDAIYKEAQNAVKLRGKGETDENADDSAGY